RPRVASSVITAIRKRVGSRGSMTASGCGTPRSPRSSPSRCPRGRSAAPMQRSTRVAGLEMFRSIVAAMTRTAPDETGPLDRVLLKHATDAFGDQGRIDAAWRSLRYLDAPDAGRACAEYDAFAALIEQHGAELVYLPADHETGLDSIYVRDAAVLAPDGV